MTTTPHNTNMVLFLMVTTMLTFSCSSSSACNQKDKNALLAFKNSLNPSSYELSWSASSTSDCCSWDFIICDSTTGRVTSLDFSNMYDAPEVPILNGSIPAAIGDLTALERIHFERISTLVGPIPPQLAKLKKLQYLEIYITGVSGPIPSFLSELPALRRIWLGSSRFSGPIPSSLGNLASLTEINIYRNSVTGTIPASLFGKLNKGSAATLNLSNNRLRGAIPRSFANVNFDYFDVSYNHLCGKIPTGGNFSQFPAQTYVHNKCLCGTPLPLCK